VLLSTECSGCTALSACQKTDFRRCRAGIALTGKPLAILRRGNHWLVAFYEDEGGPEVFKRHLVAWGVHAYPRGGASELPGLVFCTQGCREITCSQWW
jgi:hypothetical protein